MHERRIDCALPDSLTAKLHAFGEDISAARRARRISQRELASRLNIGQPTVVRMEKGDPKVSFGVYAATAWIFGIEKNLLSAFDPAGDPVFQREARLDLPKRIRKSAEKPAGLGDLDF